MDGAYAAHALDPELIILGEEVDCADGTDIIGLFIQEPIPPGLPAEEVADRIRAQGGIVYAPHPYAYLRQPVRRAARAFAVADVIEVFNGRAFLPAWNRHALVAARAAGLPVAAGSDGHFAHEIGGAWTEMPAFSNAAEFLASLATARACHTRKSSPFVHVASIGVELAKKTDRLLSGAHADPAGQGKALVGIR
jgi:predicted metal-dependent phosphoesterase TrpH